MRRIALLALALGFGGSPAIAGGQPPAAAPGRLTGQDLARLIAGHVGSVEIVTFANRRAPSVRVIRGGAAAAPAAPVSDKVEIVSFTNPRLRPVTVIRGAPAAEGAGFDLFGPARAADLDLVAFAVDGAESSHGADLRMWRPDPRGPEGPMQVSEAAALDVGGGDRFDLGQNRLLGRAYLAHLYRRYGNWPDAVAAYNWGPGNLDAWILAGRLHDGLPLEVERYRDRVLREVGLQHSLDAVLHDALPPFREPPRKPPHPTF